MRTPSLHYRVELASGAWRHVSTLDRLAFKSLMEGLRQIAADAPTVIQASTANTMKVEVGELAALFEVDHSNATVLVTDIIKRSVGEG